LERRRTPIQGWFTSLLVWRKVWLQRQAGYFTFPVSVFFGLRAALDEMFSMSLPELYRRYAVVAKAIRYAVREMGLDLAVSGQNCPGCDSPQRFCADTATAIRYPPTIRHDDFAQLMHEQYGISIAGTYGPLAGRAFRVGPTGLMQIGRGFNLNLLGCIGMAFQQLGFPVNVGRALSMADSILSEL
jgi:(S)-ureidoglycine-glyoxylate aminotransferase